MNRLVGGISLLALLACTFAAAAAFANTSNVPKRAYVAPLYNASREITLGGTVESLIRKPTAGMLPGAHLMISTAHGVVDAQLGRFGLQLRGASSLAPGQPVTVVGVMATINHQNVLITRLIQTANQTIQVRTAGGFVMLPGAKPHPAAAHVFGGAR